METSISQKPGSTAAGGFPDFRNFGVVLRTLLGINALGIAAAVLLAKDLSGALPLFVELSYRLEIPLLITVALLAAGSTLLSRLPAVVAAAATMALAAAVAMVTEDAWRFLGFNEGVAFAPLRAALLAVFASALVLGYFALRAQAAGPAVTEARVAALTARIRPHFLFNSLNAVLALMRDDPRRAETALENLAELFRALMRDPRDLSPLSEEIALCRQYLELEKLRLGERLRVEWRVADVPGDALVPPLMIQPLLENAVYHGIEPAVDGGTVSISFERRDKSLLIELENPVAATGAHAGGNHMALANIRERLALHYDLEARLVTRIRDGVYHVGIELPFRQKDLRRPPA